MRDDGRVARKDKVLTVKLSLHAIMAISAHSPLLCLV
jgi:hypothetical protein